MLAVGRHYPHFEPFQITLPYPLDRDSRQMAVAPVLVGANKSQEVAIAAGIEGVLAVDVSTALHLPTERRGTAGAVVDEGERRRPQFVYYYLPLVAPTVVEHRLAEKEQVGEPPAMVLMRMGVYEQVNKRSSARVPLGKSPYLPPKVNSLLLPLQSAVDDNGPPVPELYQRAVAVPHREKHYSGGEHWRGMEGGRYIVAFCVIVVISFGLRL